MKKTTYPFFMLLLIFMVALAACANQPTTVPEPEPTLVASGTVVAEGRIRPVHAVNLSFQALGVVEEIQVKIGDPVAKGDVLARLSSAAQAEAQLTAANLERVDAQQALDALTRTGGTNLATTWNAYLEAQEVRAEAERDWEALNLDNIESRIDDARVEVEDRRVDVEDAQTELDKYADVDEDNSRRQTAEDDLERAQEQLNEAIRELEETTRERDSVRSALDAALAAEAEARHQYELSANGANTDQLALATARLENARAQVAAAEAALGNFILTAPFDGVVMDVAIEIGQQVSAESRALSLADTSAWIVETTDVTELEVVRIEPGQAVTFTADALSEVVMNGVVTEISQSSTVQSGDVIYTVRIQAEEVDPRVKWGMTVEVTFESLGAN